jgi:hypothetical protein
MFQWYQEAQVCYAYLSDVPDREENPWDDYPSDMDKRSHFRRSIWFNRGWTLQELLAPERVEVFDREWREIGTKLSYVYNRYYAPLP